MLHVYGKLVFAIRLLQGFLYVDFLTCRSIEKNQVLIRSLILEI